MARLIRNYRGEQQIFVHSAKTGGTFFREALNYFGIRNNEIMQKHSSIYDIRKLYSAELYPAFGFVRNPVTWYKSRWAYGMMTYFGEKIKYMPEAQAHWMADVWSNDFKIFVMRTLEKYPNGIAWEYFNNMLALDNREEMNITIYRYENLQYITTAALQSYSTGIVSLNEVSTLPVTLSSKRFDVEVSPGLQMTIQEVEHKLIKEYY